MSALLLQRPRPRRMHCVHFMCQLFEFSCQGNLITVVLNCIHPVVTQNFEFENSIFHHWVCQVLELTLEIEGHLYWKQTEQLRINCKEDTECKDLANHMKVAQHINKWCQKKRWHSELYNRSRIHKQYIMLYLHNSLVNHQDSVLCPSMDTIWSRPREGAEDIYTIEQGMCDRLYWRTGLVLLTFET